VPLLAEFLILAVCISFFYLFYDLGPMIEEPTLVGEAMTKPKLGRLAFGIAALLLWFIFTLVASKSAKKERHYTSSFLGFASGILLWQFVGEISWHYSVGGVHFVPLESVTTLPLAILFILLLIYGKKHHNDYRMSKRRTSLFAADKSAEAKSRELLFATISLQQKSTNFLLKFASKS
jgi:hypothetical protein